MRWGGRGKKRDRDDLETSLAAGFQGAGVLTEAVAYHATDDESRNTKKS